MFRIKFAFSVISNIRNPINRYINNRVIVYDQNIDRYQDLQVIAYTHKRRLTKGQIPPKIYILQNSIPQIQQQLSNQLFSQNVQVISLDMMGALYEQMQITSAYVYTKFHQKHLKQLLQSYAGKVLMNGKMPPIDSVSTYNKSTQKVMDLYRLSKLQQFVQSEYLTLKNNKHDNYMKSSSKSIKRKNELLRCIWNLQNQRSLQGYANWQSRPFDDYADFRPFFKDIVLASHTQQDQYNTIQISAIAQINNISKQNINFISIQLFNRLLEWCGSLQFTRILKLPADFLIQLSSISAHVWMIVSKLNRQKNTQLLIKAIIKQFQTLIGTKLAQISQQTNSQFHIEVYQKFLYHWKAYQSHFQTNHQNKYTNLDSLIYSTVLFSKVQRNSDSVYLISQYLYKNYQLINTLTLEQILKGKIQFDVYVVDPDYKSKFMNSIQIYPFEDQLKSILLPINKPKLELENKSFSSKMFRLMNVLVKGLKSFDFYSEVEKQEKQNKLLNQTGWKFDEDIDQEITTIQKFRTKNKK